jgi:hypothetical protein
MRRLLLPALTMGLLVGLAGRAAAQDDAKELIKKAIAAHGGADKIDKFKGARAAAKGSVSLMGMDLEFTADTISQFPDKQKITIKLDFGGMAATVIQTVNGDKASLSFNGMSMPLPDAQKDSLKQSCAIQKMMNLTPLLSDKGYELKAIPGVKIGDKETVGVEVKGKDLKDPVKVYFDKSTNLIARVEHKGLDPMGMNEINQEITMSDYKDVQGVKKPMKTVVSHDGTKFMEQNVTKLELVEKIDDKEFAD